jgi:hypothetical protein
MTESACIDHGLKGRPQGYAMFWDAQSGKKMLAHRKVFRDLRGFLPPVVMHTCDNPRCINPDHLEAGDWKKNNQDRATKKRSAKSRPDKRHLTHDEVRAIRRRYVPGYSREHGVTALAREFGVDTNVIYQITSGRTYAEVQ